MKKRALYIGRFQPFHNGHLDTVHQILSHENGYDQVIIAVGSADKSFAPRNPLTAGERLEIIDRALRDEGIAGDQCILIPVWDIGRPSVWPYHVRSLCPEFSAIFSGSEYERMLWEYVWFGGRKMDVFSVQKRRDVSATLVREKILSGASLKDYVPCKIEKYLRDELRMKERLENMRMT